MDNRKKFVVPLIDFSKYLHGTPAERAACVQQIMDGFTTSGFLMLQNSGVDPGELDSVYSWSQRFFALPMDEKEKKLNTDFAANRGYSRLSSEKTTNASDPDDIAALRTQAPDLKESLEMGSEPGERYPEKPYDNPWPEALPAFKPAMTSFFRTCDELHHVVMGAIAEGLGLPADFFRPFAKKGDHVLRLLHYPAMEPELLNSDSTVRAGSHTDYGTITLLFTDDSGGLQIQYPDGEFYEIDPVPGAIVINAGDILQIWSNDTIKSTHHRVMPPSKPKMTFDGKVKPRYSIAFFAHPDHDLILDTIRTCFDPVSRPKKYQPLNPGDWMIKRLTATY
ncbi:Clavaminate synthase-like protein [Pleurostoma richardsiae]|uniref:Clavaminate synthase-like protein n=1 Tax=Pleurostoma richardsiae TaxID=41990 RepID=A0AA38RSU0_9PEZI|nr:Clavaminate synthase-like protein [Pleurostoma richardsiae]